MQSSTFGGESHSPSEITTIDKRPREAHQRRKSEPNSLTIEAAVNDHIRRRRKESWMTPQARQVYWAGLRGASNEKGRDTG